MQEPTSQPDQPPAGGNRKGFPSTTGLLWLVLGLCLLAMAQQFHGIGPVTRLTVETAKIKYEDGIYRWKLPPAYQGPVVELAADLSEKKQGPLTRARSRRTLPQQGKGCYFVANGAVFFLPADGSDPRSNGQTFTVAAPTRIRPWVFWLLGGLLLAVNFLTARASGTGGIGPTPEGATPPPPARWQGLSEGTWVFLGASAWFLARLWVDWDFSDGIFVLKGIPESDAAGWYQMAVNLAEGRGFESGFSYQRPFFSVLLAGIFAVLSPSLWVVKSALAMACGLATAGVWSMARTMRVPLAGVALAALMMLAPQQAAMPHRIMTECGGLVFAVFTLLACTAAGCRGSIRWAAAAGALCGIGNLTSGALILTAALYPAGLFLHGFLRKWPWKKNLLVAGVFMLTCAVTMGPWIVRQKIKYGYYTLSYANAEHLYGGSRPDTGRLTQEDVREAQALGLEATEEPGLRYAHFGAKFRQIVQEDPIGYLKRVAYASVKCLEYSAVTGPLVSGALAMALLAAATLATARGRGPWQPVLAAGAGVALVLASPAMLAPLALGCWLAGLCFARDATERFAVGLLGLTVLAMAAAGGLSGNLVSKRLWVTSDWALVLLIFHGLDRLLDRAAARAGKWTARLFPSDRAPMASGPALPSGFWMAGSAALLGLALFATIFCLARTAAGPKALFHGIEAEARSLATAREALAGHALPGVVAAAAEIDVRMVMPDDFNLPLAAGEDTGHWLSLYMARPYARTVIGWSALTRDGTRVGRMMGMVKGDPAQVPRCRPALWLGVFSKGFDRLNQHPQSIAETIGLIPLTETIDGHWESSPQDVIWFPPPPEAMAVVPP